MASIRNFTATDNGVRWDLSFEWQPDGGGTWTLWEGQLPRDLDDIHPDEKESALQSLSLAIARGQGVLP